MKAPRLYVLSGQVVAKRRRPLVIDGAVVAVVVAVAALVWGLWP